MFIEAIKSFQVDALQVDVYEAQNEMAQAAAQMTRSYLQEVLDRQEIATIIWATGSSQIQFLQALTHLGGVDWSRIVCFHLDEYLGVDADCPVSFCRYLRERIEQQVNPRMFHYIQGDCLQPLDECDRYTKLLLSQPIDLCCLGLGENGHLAFNDPSVADFKDSRTIKLVKLDEMTRQQQVKTGYFPHLDAVPQYAFTLTLPTICSARKIVCLAPEKRKAIAVREMLSGTTRTSIPASILRNYSQAVLYLDVDSAGLL